MNQKLKTLLYLIGGLSLLMALAYMVSSLTKSLEVGEFTKRLGIFGPIFLTFGVAIGGIIVPLTSLPFLLAGLVLYGFWATFLIYYLGNTFIAPIIDFWIARKWGRPIVAKLAGRKALTQIDQIAKFTGVKALAVLRIFGGILFDTTSYAIGLTNMKFKTYLLLTTTLPIPGMLIALYLIHKGLISSPLYLAIIVVWGYSAGALTSYWIYKESKKIK